MKTKQPLIIARTNYALAKYNYTPDPFTLDPLPDYLRPQLTYRQLKHRQTCYRLITALLIFLGFLVVAYMDGQYLLKNSRNCTDEEMSAL